jgi:asparagine synthase (glutamine-hydrolysing)
VHTFTLAFEEEEFNEGHAARAIARAIGTEHREVLLTEQRFLGQMEQALDSLDQPTFDGLNSYFMSRAVRDAGFTVALVGTGGDELFGGYTSFHDLPVLQRWARRLAFLPRAALVRVAELMLAALQGQHGAIPRQTRWAKLPEMVRRGDDLLALYQLAYALFLPEFQRQLLGPELAEALVDGLPAQFRARLEGEVRGRSGLAAISVLEQRLFLGERLLRDNDAASMAGVDRATVAAGGPGPARDGAPPPDAARYEPGAPQGDAPAERPAGARPGAVRAAQAWLRAAL